MGNTRLVNFEIGKHLDARDDHGVMGLGEREVGAQDSVDAKPDTRFRVARLNMDVGGPQVYRLLNHESDDFCNRSLFDNFDQALRLLAPVIFCRLLGKHIERILDLFLERRVFTEGITVSASGTDEEFEGVSFFLDPKIDRLDSAVIVRVYQRDRDLVPLFLKEHELKILRNRLGNNF